MNAYGEVVPEEKEDSERELEKNAAQRYAEEKRRRQERYEARKREYEQV